MQGQSCISSSSAELETLIKVVAVSGLVTPQIGSSKADTNSAKVSSRNGRMDVVVVVGTSFS